MKKILSLLLSLLLLAAPALAETAPATQLLTSPDGSYTFEVPADYVPINPETLKILGENETMRKQLSQALGIHEDQLYESLSGLSAGKMVYVYGPDFQANLNVQTVDAAGLTMEVMVMFKDTMDQILIEQYAAWGIPASAIHPMDIQQIGGRQWYGMSLEFAGMEMLQMITEQGGVQYMFTFADMEEDVITAILESFTILAE